MASISVCMIVKNEYRNLVRTLPNLVAALDEVIVVDTGSVDGTIEFATQCGAKVVSFEWKNDFAAARNFSLTHATCDWILWADADEWLSPFELPLLKQFLDTYAGSALGLPMCECPDGTYEPDHTYYRAKLFRNGLGIHFDRPFNEQVTLEGRTLYPEQNSDVVQLIHWGSLFHLMPDDRQRKIKRNHEILTGLIDQFPNDAGYLYSLAMTKIGMEPPDEIATIDLLMRAHIHCPDPELDALILYKLGQILFRSGQHARLDQWLAELLESHPDFVPFLNLLATRELMKGHYQKAVEIVRHTISVMGTQSIAEQVDANEYGSIPYEKLGLAYLGLGQLADARVALAHAQMLNPNGDANRFLKMVEEREFQCQ